MEVFFLHYGIFVNNLNILSKYLQICQMTNSSHSRQEQIWIESCWFCIWQGALSQISFRSVPNHENDSIILSFKIKLNKQTSHPLARWTRLSTRWMISSLLSVSQSLRCFSSTIWNEWLEAKGSEANCVFYQLPFETSSQASKLVQNYDRIAHRGKV